MIYKSIVIAIFFSLSLTSTALTDKPETNDFETLCTIFKEAIESNEENIQVRSDYISTQIDERIASKEVAEIYYALFNIAPNERYSVLVDTAKHYTNSTWTCLPAQKIMN